MRLGLRFRFLVLFGIAFMLKDTLGIYEALPHEFPWIVRIVNNGSLFYPCHGAILNENWVVTDPYCVDGLSRNLKVYAGDHDQAVFESSEQIRKVRRIIRSPQRPTHSKSTRYGSHLFDGFGVGDHTVGDEYEIRVEGHLALVELETPLLFHPIGIHNFVLPIALATPETVYTSGLENVSKVFWLRRTPNNSLSTKLMKTVDSIMSDEACNLYYFAAIDEIDPYYVNFDEDTIVCSGSHGFMDTNCDGIQAQPLICQSDVGPVLCGIGTLYVSLCDEAKRGFNITIPDTYSEIQAFTQWISDRIKVHPETNATWVHQEIGCGGVLNGSAGHLSYKLGETVLPNERCTWTIRVLDLSSIRLRLINGPTGSNDFLAFSEFVNEEEFMTTVFTHSGTEYVFQGPAIFITFSSGAHSPGEGFSLEFYGSGQDQALGYNWTDVCLNSTEMTSYHYPADAERYSNYAAGTFVINPEGRLNINLTFTYLNIICLRDFLYIYKWNGNQFYFLERICPQNDLPSFSTDQGLFIILFTSGNRDTGKGFTITY